VKDHKSALRLFTCISKVEKETKADGEAPASIPPFENVIRQWLLQGKVTQATLDRRANFQRTRKNGERERFPLVKPAKADINVSFWQTMHVR